MEKRTQANEIHCDALSKAKERNGMEKNKKKMDVKMTDFQLDFWNLYDVFR